MTRLQGNFLDGEDHIDYRRKTATQLNETATSYVAILLYAGMWQEKRANGFRKSRIKEAEYRETA